MKRCGNLLALGRIPVEHVILGHVCETRVVEVPRVMTGIVSGY